MHATEFSFRANTGSLFAFLSATILRMLGDLLVALILQLYAIKIGAEEEGAARWHN